MNENVRQNCLEILETIPEYLEELNDNFQTSSNQLRVGKDNDGIEGFSNGISEK